MPLGSPFHEVLGGGAIGQGAEGEQAWEWSELNFGIDFLKIRVD